MALDRVVIALALHLLSLHLLALTLFTLAVGHFLLALALENLPFPGVALALAVQSLGGCMLHSLTDTGKRVAGAVGWAWGVLSVRRRLVRSPVALAQLCQSGEGVTTGLAAGVVGACNSAPQLVYHPDCIDPRI